VSIGKADYKYYFEGVQEAVHEDIFTDPGQQIFSRESWLSAVYDDSEMVIDEYLNQIKSVVGSAEKLEVSLLDQFYEKMIFAELSRPKGFPDLAQYRTAYFEGKPFPDCVDTTERNLCNVVSFDAKTNTFNPAQLKGAHPSAACISFYADPLNKKASEIENPLVHNAWTNVIENQPYVSYNRVIRLADKQELCCAVNQAFNGFMHATDALKKEARGKIEFAFGEGNKESFDVIEVARRQFVLVDPKRFATFELMPSLKNTIILMNELFGLELYENIEKAFFDSSFNEIYFPALAKKFDWDYKKPAENLDQSDYQKIEISVGTPAGSFELKLSKGHGQLILLSKVAHEPYQEKLADFARVELLKLTQDNRLPAYSFLINVLALYHSEEKAVFKAFLDYFQQFQPLKTIWIYMQRLQDPNVKLSVIKAIVTTKNPEVYDLAVSLIKSLPLGADLYYLNELSKIDFSQAIADKKQGKKLASVLTEMYDEMLKGSVNENTFKIASGFLTVNIFDDKAVALVRQIFKVEIITLADLQMTALRFLKSLNEKGKGYDLTMEIAMKLIDTHGLGLKKAFPRKQGFIILEILAAQKKHIPEIIEIALRALKSGSYADQGEGAMKVFVKLVEVGEGYDAARIAARMGIDQWAWETGTTIQALKLLGKLVDKDLAIEEAKNAVQKFEKDKFAKAAVLELKDKLASKGIK